MVGVGFTNTILNPTEFIDFHNGLSDDICLDIGEKIGRMTDEYTKTVIRKTTGCDSVSDFQELDKRDKIKAVRLLRKKGCQLGK